MIYSNSAIEFFRKNSTRPTATKKPLANGSKRLLWLNTFKSAETLHESSVVSKGNKSYTKTNTLTLPQKKSISPTPTMYPKTVVSTTPIITKTLAQSTPTKHRPALRSHQAKQVNLDANTNLNNYNTPTAVKDNSNNFYFPLTETFPTFNMNLKVNQTIQALEQSRLTFQQVMANNKIERNKNINKQSSDFINPPNPNDDGSWTEVKTKEKKDKQPADEPTTPKIFPNAFPPATTDEIELDTITPTTTTGVTVTVRLADKTQLHYNSFLKAMLLCFQLVDPYASITTNGLATPDESHVAIDFFQPDDIEANIDHLEKYLDEPTRKKRTNIFTTRIYVKTKVPMKKILQEKKVKEWQRNEKVYYEVNNLKEAHLINVGFLFESFPRNDSTVLFQRRIQNALGDHNFNFHLTIDSIFPERAPNLKTAKKYPQKYGRSQVMIIRAPHYEADELNSEIQSLTSTPEFTYYSWNEYMSLSNDQKRTIVNQQEQFIQNYKILTLKQIKDNVNTKPMFIKDDIDMLDDEFLSETHKNYTSLDLYSTNIQTFLTDHYKAGDGQQLFDYVYQPINETIELLVSREHFNEAKACVKVLIKDLQFFCNQEARETLFNVNSPQDNIGSSYKPWKSYKLGTHTLPTIGIPKEIIITPPTHNTLTEKQNPTPSNPNLPAIPSHNKTSYATRASGPPLATNNSTATHSTEDLSVPLSEAAVTDIINQKCEDLVSIVEVHSKTMHDIIDSKLKKYSEETLYKMQQLQKASEQRQYVVINDHFISQGEKLLANFTSLLTSHLPTTNINNQKKQPRTLRSSKTMTPRKRTNKATTTSGEEDSSSDESDTLEEMIN
jgi:hypothetical protein